MIAYSEITLQQAIDILFMEMGEHRNEENIDWDTLVLFINRAIREVMVLTLPYTDWAYVSNIEITHGGVLPRNYLKYLRVLASWEGQPPLREARYVDPREYFTLTNWQRRQEWNRCTWQNPIFTIWGQIAGVGLVLPPEPTQLTIYLGPNDDYITGTAPAGYIYPIPAPPNNPGDPLLISGMMDCYIAPDDITASNNVLSIPYEYEDLVVMSALSRVYAKTADREALVTTYKKILEEKRRINLLYFEKKRTERRELESFVEPIPPYAPRLEEPGELPQKLV